MLKVLIFKYNTLMPLTFKYLRISMTDDIDDFEDFDRFDDLDDFDDS